MFQPLYQKGDQVWLEATHLKLPYQATKLNPKQSAHSLSLRSYRQSLITLTYQIIGGFITCSILRSSPLIKKPLIMALISHDHPQIWSKEKRNKKSKEFLITDTTGMQEASNI
jgi:hypothetical protein